LSYSRFESNYIARQRDPANDLYEHVLISYVERARLALVHFESVRNTLAFTSLFLWNLQTKPVVLLDVGE
jgi:hypothetical protein